MEYKDIIVLAKTKIKDRYYISGVNSKTKEWTRLVAEYEEGKIGPVDIEDLTYLDDKTVAILDMIRIPVKQPTVSTFQPENYVIDDRYYISKIGKCELNYLANLSSSEKMIFHSYSNVVTKNQSNSDEFNTLMLVRPDLIYIKVSNLEERKLKIDIKYEGITYTDFPVFDEYFTTLYFDNVANNPSNEIIMRDVYLVIALSKANKNNEHLKVVESIIVVD